MTHQDLVRTTPGANQGKRKQRAWLAGGLAVAVAGFAIAATLALWHPGSDPGDDGGGDPAGVRQKSLRSISVAIPPGATIQAHSVGRPIWGTCGGKPGTPWGWTDVIEDYEFTSTRSAAAVVAGAEAKMKTAGWTLISTSTTPLGPSTVWAKTVSGNVKARALLGVGTRGPSCPCFWEIAASAPPAGRRASGC